MPNGRSGGFKISVDQFRQLIQGLSGEVPIGKVIIQRSFEPLTVFALAQRLDQLSEEEVFVEEQDYRSYIAHLGLDHTSWIIIHETSPLCEGLRQCHAECIQKGKGVRLRPIEPS